MKSPAFASLLALSCLMGAASSAAQAADEHVALVKNVAGAIRIVHEGASMPASAGATLFVADKLVSGQDGSAGIVFKDGTLLTVGASSEVELRDYVFKPNDSKYAFSLYLAKGSAIYASGKIGKLAPESVQVSTPTATVGVRGTRFLIEAAPEER